MKLNEALQTAIDFEQKGYDIYVETSQSTKNPIVAQTFTYLAEQEIKHKKAIENFLSKKHPELKISLDTREQMKEFFTTTVSSFKEKTRLSQDDESAHKAALDLEKSSYEFYKAECDKSDDESVKKFLTFMMKQEQNHYDLIEKAFWFVRDPEGFYAEEEQWFVEG